MCNACSSYSCTTESGKKVYDFEKQLRDVCVCLETCSLVVVIVTAACFLTSAARNPSLELRAFSVFMLIVSLGLRVNE